jgi:YVTN family beta-propeller protein
MRRNVWTAPAVVCIGWLWVGSAGGPSLGADDSDQLRVGVQPDGRIVVPTNQILKPAGTQITFPGRPVDLAFADSGRTLVVKNLRSLVFIDVAGTQIKQTLMLPRRGDPKPGFSVVGLLVQGERIFASDAQNEVRVAQRQADGSYRWRAGIELIKPKVGGLVHPAGLGRLSPELLWVAATRGNEVQLVNAETGNIEQQVPVGVAPYTVWCRGPGRYYVSNWGGDPPKEGDPQAKSSGTPIRVDPRTRIADHGTVSVLGRVDGRWTQVRTINVGLHPSGMIGSPSGTYLYVANANSDTVSVIDTRSDQVVETVPCRPEARLPFGSGSNALALSPDGATLYVANGTNNCVAVIRLARGSSEGGGDRPARSTLAGLIPTGWYPGALLLSPDGKRLFVGNVKGHGSLHQPRPLSAGRRSHDHLGSVSVIDVPDAGQLGRYTDEVNANNRLGYSLAGLEKPRAGVAPVPVPLRHGEPSVFRHVIYIIKENRTYDQVFGDLKEGDGDPNLVLFGEDVTPNHHALARQFTLFDNFYCSGVLSADGHSWVNEAYVTDYLEKAFGGFTRSYPDAGQDPLAYPATGFLWDNALAHGKTLRNYGEFVENTYDPPKATWTDLYNDYRHGTHKVKITAQANLKSLAPYTHPRYPWFPLVTPDVYRARMFLEELGAFEKQGTLPNLLYVTLPCDHTEGTKPDYPTPRAMVADNDLALGRIVEGVSKSRFWPDTCIFVVEDDPQDGFDHVDAHRTVALVISPYTKRKFVDHTNYNQTGMVKTIELLLGLPPMNQLDLSATPLRNCFRTTPALTPYACLPNRIRLDQMNPALFRLDGQALHWAKKSLALNLEQGDKADEDTLNRILWHATRGYDTPYPERFAGKKVEDAQPDADE